MRGFRFLRSILATGILVLTLLMVGSVQPATAQEGSLEDPDDIASFADETLAEHVEEYDLAGVVASVVKDGEVVYSGGHGLADVDQEVPADPQGSLFRIGSVTKLFTWTAVMQLVEDGEIELDEDLRPYLPESMIDGDRNEPITMNQLMSHTAGFDTRVVGLFGTSSEDVGSLEETLIDELPPRVREPGMYSSYSNYGVGVAGYVVEQITGMSWEAYVEENILGPLDMERTTPRQPIPEEIDARMATGYEDAGGDLSERGFEYVGVPPAGSISSTADDMARFMIAHLDNGTFGDAQILSQDTAEQMHTQHFAHDPAVGGWAHGFMERYYSGQRFIGHDGATLVFVSNLWLDKEEDLGVFLSYNTRQGGMESGQEFIQAFADRYYGEDGESTPESPSGSDARISDVAGDYRAIQLPGSNIDRVLQLIGVMSVAQEDQSTISVGPLGGDPMRFQESDPYEFQPADDDESMGTMVFRERPAGDGYDMFAQNTPETSYEPVPWYDGLILNLAILGISLVLFLTAVIAWPINAFRKRNEANDPAPSARLAGPIAGLASILYILFVVFLGVPLSGDPNAIAFGVPTIAKVGLALAIGAAIAAIPALVLAVISWVRGHWGLIGRIHLTVVAIAAVTMIWWSSHWNLLGFQY